MDSLKDNSPRFSALVSLGSPRNGNKTTIARSQRNKLSPSHPEEFAIAPRAARATAPAPDLVEPAPAPAPALAPLTWQLCATWTK